MIVESDTDSTVTYDGKNFGTGSGVVSGRMMGKTRYFTTGSDGDIILPRNHVSRFIDEFKVKAYTGTQNITNSGSKILNVRHEDYSSASFYSVTVTGGEQSIYVRGKSNPSKGDDDKIIY